MDYIDGEMLEKWLEKNTLTQKDKNKLIGLLEKLHKKKILHQDLHSNNIMVSENRRFYLIDYGLSRDNNESFRLEMDGFLKAMANKKFHQWTSQTEMSRFRQSVDPSSNRYQLEASSASNLYPFDVLTFRSFVCSFVFLA